jgi:peptidylprolyl isomerase
MIKQGNTVKVHYTGRLEDNQVFDSSDGKQPIEFQVGSQQVIEGFETGVIGLNKGDKTTVTIPADKAYGEVRQDLIMSVPRTQVPQDVTPGAQLQGMGQNGEPFNVTVTEVNESDVLLDANHPLAGKTLIFDLEVVDVV